MKSSGKPVIEENLSERAEARGLEESDHSRRRQIKNWLVEVSDTWAACGWLPGVRPGSVSEYSHWEKCLE